MRTSGIHLYILIKRLQETMRHLSEICRCRHIFAVFDFFVFNADSKGNKYAAINYEGMVKYKMVIMMVLPIRLKMQKRTGKPTPTLLITTDQEWEVSYSPIQSKSGETIISTCLHFGVVQQLSLPLLLYDTIYFHELEFQKSHNFHLKIVLYRIHQHYE